MASTSRELVQQTLEFRNPRREPRHLGILLIARLQHSAELDAILAEYPPEVEFIGGHEREKAPIQGDPYEVGESVDAWGARFVNLQRGVHGEGRSPLVRDWCSDRCKIHIPREWLTVDRDAVDRDCAATSCFTMAGCYPRPFEQLQFLRGTAALYMDLLDNPPGFREFVKEMHAFYTELLTVRAATDVDCLQFIPDFAIGQNRQDARRGRCRCMRILRTSRNAADCLFSTILKGLRIGCFFSSDMAFTWRKRWATALHFNSFVRSTIQIPANSKTQNLVLWMTGAGRRRC